MFSLRQISVAGLLGVYAGCLTLTVNLRRLPYTRGAYVGVFFGSLTHMLAAWVDLCLALSFADWFNDPTLSHTLSRVAVVAACVLVQIMSAVGCTIMGAYFMAPSTRREPFQREKLLEKLSKRDTGKRSVVHDVVQCLTQTPPLPDVRFSHAWIALAAVCSAASMALWLFLLYRAIIDCLFFGIPQNGDWYLMLSAQFMGVWLLLILVHLSVLWILGAKNTKT